MTRKMIHFSRAFLPCAIISSLIIVFGIVGFFIRGINFGIDYKPGLIEEIRVAPAVMDITYSGSANVTFDITNTKADIVISGTGAENETKEFKFTDNQTVNALAESLRTVDGVNVTVNSYGDSATSELFVNSDVSNKLTSTAYRLYSAGKINAQIADVRQALASVSGVSIKQLGSGSDMSFQIRMADNGDGTSSRQLQETVISKLSEKFGADNIAVVKTDFIGSNFSKTIALQSIILLAATVALIWLYSAIRFHWDFALGAVIALFHDSLMMMTFIVWSQMEFSTMIVAAILTIVGYSINDTIVILDRERSLLPVLETKKFNDILDQALTDTLSRSIITTATTMFAAASLYIFTTGEIKNFALALIVGLISGCYSSIFISSGFISATRKNWKPEYGIHHSLRMHKGVLDTGVTV
ncbi:MAG: protein translocase subunit SecF [Treponema sp.]|nr:protein translocase subunit SecF [Treponema sp.]